jgi:hypothetical protein
MLVDTHDRGFRKRFAAASARREARLRASFAEAGVDCLELSTEDDLVDSIRSFADLRKRRSRTASAPTRNQGQTTISRGGSERGSSEKSWSVPDSGSRA